MHRNYPMCFILSNHIGKTRLDGRLFSLGASIAKNFDPALDRDQRGRKSNKKVWPIRAEPPDKDTRDQDAAVRDEVVVAEGCRGSEVDVRILNALQELQA